MEKGFFKEEGIDLQVDVGYGADKSMTAVLSGNADVALCGTEAAIYVHAEGRDDVPVVFAQLTQRAGNFLVGREAESDFKWTDLKGQTIIGGREGGMPEMVLEYILKKNGLDPKKDLEIITNLAVSYTHLDVYKRQGIKDGAKLHPGLQGCEGQHEQYPQGSCLLYTSRCV